MEYLCDNLKYKFTVGMTVNELLTLNLAITVNEIFVRNVSCLIENLVLYINFNDIPNLSNLIKLIHNLKSFHCENRYLRVYKSFSLYNFMNYKGGIFEMLGKPYNYISPREAKLRKEFYASDIVTDDTLLLLPETLESLVCDYLNITGSCFTHFKHLKNLSCEGCKKMIPDNLSEIKERIKLG